MATRFSFHVLTVDGTSLSVNGQGILALCLFMFLILFMFLGLPCNSFLVVRLLTPVVGSFLTLNLALFKIVTRALYLVLALAVIIPKVSGS